MFNGHATGTDLFEVTICKAYFSGLWKGISPQNMVLYGTVPQFQDPKMEVLYHIRPYFMEMFPYIGLI